MRTLARTASPRAAQAQVATGKRLEFEVASVRKNKSEDEASMNVGPVLGDGPVPPGNLYLAKNIKLILFIAFAYSLTQIQYGAFVRVFPDFVLGDSPQAASGIS
jgi:hypothetical protein